MDVVRFEYTNSSSTVKINDSRYTERIKSIALESIIGKQDFYNIRSGETNVLTWLEGTTALTTTITEGNYSAITLPTAIKNAMDAESTASGAGYTYTVTLSLTHFTTSVAVSTGTMTITPDTTEPDLFYILGFHANSSDASTVYADSCYNTLPDWLELRVYGTSGDFFDVDGNIIDYIAWQVPITGLSGSMIYFLNTSENCYKHTSKSVFSLKTVSLKIFDNLGYQINNRGNKMIVNLRIDYAGFF